MPREAEVEPLPAQAQTVAGQIAARRRLVRQLRLAYSGELAAAFAYRGHARSVRRAEERARISRIEDEEWHHRRIVGALLADLDSGPSLPREAVFWVIGRVIALLCHVSGWYAAMYGAGRLESRNVKEYEDAARYAVACGRGEMVSCLLAMAEVEWDHERYFRERVASHRLSRIVPPWKPIPPRESIRAPFAAILEAEGYPMSAVPRPATAGAATGPATRS